MRPSLVAFFCSTVLFSSAAAAEPIAEWSGWYAGGSFGYLQGSAATAPSGSTSFGSVIGGLDVGYNTIIRNSVLFGIEADITFPNSADNADQLWSRLSPTGETVAKLDYVATLRPRVGYFFGNTLLYGTGGLALSSIHVVQSDAILGELRSPTLLLGWAAGAGIEFPVDTNWRTRLEYMYTSFGQKSVVFPNGTFDANYNAHTIKLGLNRSLNDLGLVQEPKKEDAPQDDRWGIHTQATFIYQGYPSFHALYTGTNSLPPWAQATETLSASAFLGFRLWQGAEVYYNPELLQGFGLSETTGAAGFPNGEAQKSNFLYPHYNTSRLFLRQMFGFGGEQENVEEDYGELGGKKDYSRLTIQVGKFAVHDIFDNNKYAQDPRADFMNWSIWAAGAFDYAADRVGLTYGGVVDFNQKNWAVRAGYFLIGDKSNSNDFDSQVFKRGEYASELEYRYDLMSHPGKLRFTGWLNSYFAGNFSEALDLAASTGVDANTAIVATRKGRQEYGYVINIEQELRDDIGVFGRYSWNNGQNEMTAFTDINSSFSAGASINGKTWGRSDDKLGVAFAVNSISPEYRQYLMAGGLGILIGDGALTYKNEEIVEAYYAWALSKGAILTFDYQFMANPGYNADRGPVSFFGGRVHVQY